MEMATPLSQVSSPSNRAAMLEFMKSFPFLLQCGGAVGSFSATPPEGVASDPVVLTVGSEKITQVDVPGASSQKPAGPASRRSLRLPEALKNLAEQVAEAQGDGAGSPDAQAGTRSAPRPGPRSRCKPIRSWRVQLYQELSAGDPDDAASTSLLCRTQTGVGPGSRPGTS